MAPAFVEWGNRLRRSRRHSREGTDDGDEQRGRRKNDGQDWQGGHDRDRQAAFFFLGEISWIIN